MPSPTTHPLRGIDRAALERVIVPIVRAHGAELVDIEFRPERGGWVLRLLVEKEGAAERLLSTREAAVTLELCSGISRDLSPALDVAELIDHAYSLEQGARAKLKLSDRVVIGTLTGVEGGRVRVVEGDSTQEVALADIEKARLVFEFGSGPGSPPRASAGTYKRKH